MLEEGTYLISAHNGANDYRSLAMEVLEQSTLLPETSEEPRDTILSVPK